MPLQIRPTVRTGWRSLLARAGLTFLLFEVVSGLVITFGPFHAVVQWSVIVHTILGLLTLVPIVWYLTAHWLDYRSYNLSDTVLLGYVGAVSLAVCLVSGAVVTWQGAFALKTSPVWRATHLYSTYGLLAAGLLHVLLVVVRDQRKRTAGEAAGLAWRTLAGTGVGMLAIAGLTILYPGPRYEAAFPEDYSYYLGDDRPFAPSLATTETGGPLDSDSLAGSATCGSAGCHAQIYEEWLPSAHRYAAMDPLFQKVQSVMAEQNGPESTRYCGGCHDPISLFSGTKNIFAENLTDLQGYQEGISCLSCHGIQETDLQGNANYIMTEPAAYLWQWQTGGLAKFTSDFLIRTYPEEHNELSKRMFKAPEYCAACHKQFIDEEVNRVGWVQLQNQYDNWKSSHWYTEGDPEKTVECRECHMPLIDSDDPAAGDLEDYNRAPNDGKHRSHRFIAANSLVPELMQLEGWQEHVRLTEEWLKGDFEIPEIQDKWADGPVVAVALDVPESVNPGEQMRVRVVMTANKVGHDFPTGPLDIIQAWIELHAYDPNGNEIFSSGTRDQRNFIDPGSFLFKAEPVDQYGNIIDRHNLWEMVGVRYRRALFPGYSDTVEYLIDCPVTAVPEGERTPLAETGREEQDFAIPVDAPGEYRVVAKLMYRKVDQFLINFLLGEDSGVSAPVIEMTSVERTVSIMQTADVKTDPSVRVGG